ncbi:MAG: glycosyltransferase family 39 protein [Candidatus Omnitrophica bacterium]|nr:glycosyltransferase family 39 protein [Candidatus Omnitrophota bacterium]MDD5654510.1 glycosyltransferase family 39 protein [Candidatus Omnitrophota bacterium]
MQNKTKPRSDRTKHLLILIILSSFVFLIGNNLLSLTNPDEVFYAQTAKEMIHHNSWMTPYMFGQPQFEKPILLYWLLRIGFILFGVSAFGARFFPALFGVIGVVAVYLLAVAGFKDEKKAFLCGLITLSCGLWVGLSKTVFTDMIFSVLILCSLASFYWGYVQASRKSTGILLFFAFAALAVLAKGPLGILITLLTVIIFLLFARNLKYLLCGEFFLGLCICAAISVPWYALMIKKYGTAFTHEFFYNDHYRRLIFAEHRSNDTWYFYPASMIGAMFPWSLFSLASLGYLFKMIKKNASPFYVFLACWIAVTLFVFQPAHSKLVSYILPLFPALAIITGDFVHSCLRENKKKLILGILIASAAILFMLPGGLLFAAGKYSIYVPSKTPVYILCVLILVLCSKLTFYIVKRDFQKSVFVLAAVVPLIVLYLPFVYKYAESYASSKYACEYLMKNHDLDKPIICSKFFVRGVRYYTDKEVAFLSLDGSNFYSPHPVLFLNSAEKLIEFMNKTSSTYGVFSKSYSKRLLTLDDPRLKCALLKTVGDEYILKLESNP